MNEQVDQKKRPSWLANLKETFVDSRSVQALVALLAVQLLVAGGLLWQSNSDGDFAQTTQLVAIERDAIDEIVVDDGEDGSVTLTRDGENWVMDDEHGTRASSEKIDELLSSLDDLKPGLPVASTPGSHAQLEVAEDQYQRRLTLKTGGDTVAELLLGTSPGFRKSHARTPDSDAVFAVKLNTFDIPADVEDWLDRELLAFSDVSEIQSGEIRLAAEGDNWSIVEPQAKVGSHELDSSAMDSLLASLSGLRVTGFAEPLVADEPVSDAADAASDDAEETGNEVEPLITHELAVVMGDSNVSLTITRKGSEATVERSDIPGLFGLSVATFDALTPDALQAIIVQKSAEAPVEG